MASVRLRIEEEPPVRLSVGASVYEVAMDAYTKAEVDELIAGIVGVSYEVVEQLPESGEVGTVYLLPNGGERPNTCDEYIWLESSRAFERIGTLEPDLSGYVTAEAAQAAFAAKTHSHAEYAASSHMHPASEIAGGTLSPDRLPIATASALGAVKVGNGLAIAADGTLSLSVPSASGVAF